MATFAVALPSAGADPFTALDITKAGARAEAPDFTLNRLTGGQARLAEYRGKLVLLNFWATFCPPCRKEMSGLQRLWEKYRSSNLVVLALAEDRTSAASVRDFVERNSLSFPVLLDPEGKARKRYDINALPTTYLIGPNGRIIGRAVGARDWAGLKGRALIEYLLGIVFGVPHASH